MDRSTGRVRSFVIDKVNQREILPILRENIAKETHMMTDEATWYKHVGKDFAGHDTVDHKAGEYSRGNIHTNAIEGFFSIFKRGMKGDYRHCAKRHLHRYMAEFDFRYSNRKAFGIDDGMRAEIALRGIVGKRLTYETIGA